MNVSINNILIPNGNDWSGLNDQFALGNYSVMYEYLNLYENLINLLESGCKVHPETILKRYLEIKKIKVVRFLLKYEIYRN
jgi:hypothetical protein